MKQVALTIGPQGSGKSTFCENYIKTYPNVALISRDKILFEMYGTVWLDPYTGGHYVATKVMWQRLLEQLKSCDKLILDLWNGCQEERTYIINRLRSSGVGKVEAWFFITAEDVCVEWFVKRESLDKNVGIAQWQVDRMALSDAKMCRKNYIKYHQLAVDLVGFDTIYRIDACQPPPLHELFNKANVSSHN